MAKCSNCDHVEEVWGEGGTQWAAEESAKANATLRCNNWQAGSEFQRWMGPWPEFFPPPPFPPPGLARGNLLFYRDHNDVGHGTVIGRGGWEHIRCITGGPDGILYAITNDGNLKFYRDLTRNGTGDLGPGSFIGRGGWEHIRCIAGGADGIFYAITNDGNLKFYRDLTRNGTGDLGPGSVLSQGGWNQLRDFTVGNGGVIYAMT
jgi:hypothetical protein